MFDKMTLNELKIVCKVMNIELNKVTKKADIIKLIEDAGYTYEDYEKATEESFGYEEAQKTEEIEVEVKDETKSKVVLKMKYPRSALNVSNKAYFTAEEPYGVFDVQLAAEIVRLSQGEVVEATPEEVASFYGK